MKSLVKIKIVMMAMTMIIVSVSAQVTNENIVACGMAIKTEAEAINELTQEQYCAFSTIALNPNLSAEQKNNAIASNQSIGHLIQIQEQTQNQLTLNNFSLIVNDNEKKQLLLDWLAVNVMGGIINGGGPCDKYNREVRAVGEDWLACMLKTGIMTPWSMDCCRVALRDLKNLDLEYPECANGKNGGIVLKPWIGDESTLNCPSSGVPGQ